jgi:plasmid stability protein
MEPNMPQLLIPDIDDATFERLRQRAAHHAHPVEVEVKEILASALAPPASAPWSVIDAIREELAASGRDFGDSAELVREDRDR